MYAEAFYGPERDRTAKPIGVISIVYSLDGVKQLTKSLGLQGNGYAFLLSRQGTFLTHPDETKIIEHRNIFQEEMVSGNPRIRE